jgi:predicted alpha/beta hydrolase family esterase
MRTALIIPGIHGSPDGHWQTVLQKRTPFARRVEQDDWDRPVLDQWLDRLVALTDASPGAIAVAHSLGCVLVAHAVARFPQIKIGGALLVAPADVDANIDAFPEFSNFAPMPIAPLPFPSTLVASCNDPFMTFDRAEALAVAWGSEFVNMGAAGHINIASGYGWWPAAHRLIGSLASRVEAVQ